MGTGHECHEGTNGVAARAPGYFLTMTIVALGLGLLADNLIGPGRGFDGQPTDEGRASAQEEIPT